MYWGWSGLQFNPDPSHGSGFLHIFDLLAFFPHRRSSDLPDSAALTVDL